MGVGNDLETAVKGCLKSTEFEKDCQIESLPEVRDCEQRMSINMKLIENFERTEQSVCESSNLTTPSNTSADITQNQNMKLKIEKCRQKLEDSVQNLEAQKLGCQQKLDRQRVLRDLVKEQMQRVTKQLDECEEDSGIFGFLFGF
jgi:hypothetical protein